MTEKVWKNLELKMALILLTIVALLSISLYFVMYNQYHQLVLSKLKDDAVIVHRFAEESISEEVFTELNTRLDEEKEIYITAKEQLDEIRRIANIVYLYTAKRDDNGQLIYVVDGLDTDDEDFRHIGDPIEDDFIPQLERCLNNEVVLGDDILDTEWGILYVTYFPFHDAAGNVIGAIGMEFDCENLYNAEKGVVRLLIIISLVISVIFISIAYTVVKKVVKQTEAAYNRVEREKFAAEELIQVITDASPMSCHIWDKNLNIIDCNEASLKMFGYEEKIEFITRWLKECNPECQPDGQNSVTKAMALVERVFAEGDCVFDWSHKTTAGTILPVEVTLVRVLFRNDYIVVGYIRDLSAHKELESKATDFYYDGLTGVYTMQYLNEKVESLIRVLSRSDNVLSMITADIDYFKKYVDFYGKAAGDSCIKAVAEVFTASVERSDDFVVRNSEDNFIIVLPNCDRDGVQIIAEKLLAGVRKLQMPAADVSVAGYVTVSLGITTGKVNHLHTCEDYINRTDEMLYVSKNSGRDKYTYADL